MCMVRSDEIAVEIVKSRDYLLLTREQFDQFRVSKECGFLMENYKETGRMTTKVLQSSTNAAKQDDPIKEFKKGIKRDPSVFIIFKDDRKWDQWNRSTTAHCCAQLLSEVLDSKYKPKNKEEELLFKLKQEYMYAVFEKTLLTDKGKSFVRQHEGDADAQAIYRKLKAHYLSSTTAAIDASRLLSYITSAQINDGHWRGDTHCYILHWQDQVRLLKPWLIPQVTSRMNRKE